MTTFLYNNSSQQEDQEVGSYYFGEQQQQQGPLKEKIERTRWSSMQEDLLLFTQRPLTQSKQDPTTTLSIIKRLHTSIGRQTPRLLTPYSDDFFDDENDDNISTMELTEPEATPWLFRPIAPPDDSADYDLTEHDTFQEDEDDAWASFMSGIPMEIEILNEQQRYYIEDEDLEEDNLDQIIIALRARSEELSESTGRYY